MSKQSSRRLVWTLCAIATVSSVAAYAESPAGSRTHLSVDSSDGSVTRQLVVSYSDLDLSRASDTAILYSRLKGASERVCSRGASKQGLREQQLVRECAGAALSAAVANVNNAPLAMLHSSSKSPRIAQNANDPQRT